MEMKAVGWYLDELLEYVIASNRCDELLRYLFSLIEISLGIFKNGELSEILITKKAGRSICELKIFKEWPMTFWKKAA